MSETIELSEAERAFIRHALGLSHKSVGYRNRYEAGGADIDTGERLVRKGMALMRPEREWLPDRGFVITTAGFEAAAKPGERMDEEETRRMKAFDEIASTLNATEKG